MRVIGLKCFMFVLSDKMIEWSDVDKNFGHYLLAVISCGLICFFVAMTVVVIISSEKRLGAYEESKLGYIRTNEGLIKCK